MIVFQTNGTVSKEINFESIDDYEIVKSTNDAVIVLNEVNISIPAGYYYRRTTDCLYIGEEKGDIDVGVSNCIYFKLHSEGFLITIKKLQFGYKNAEKDTLFEIEKDCRKIGQQAIKNLTQKQQFHILEDNLQQVITKKKYFTDFLNSMAIQVTKHEYSSQIISSNKTSQGQQNLSTTSPGLYSSSIQSQFTEPEKKVENPEDHLKSPKKNNILLQVLKQKK